MKAYKNTLKSKEYSKITINGMKYDEECADFGEEIKKKKMRKMTQT